MRTKLQLWLVCSDWRQNLPMFMYINWQKCKGTVIDMKSNNSELCNNSLNHILVVNIIDLWTPLQEVVPIIRRHITTIGQHPAAVCSLHQAALTSLSHYRVPRHPTETHVYLDKTSIMHRCQAHENREVRTGVVVTLWYVFWDIKCTVWLKAQSFSGVFICHTITERI